jgi:hypothetical protein
MTEFLFFGYSSQISLYSIPREKNNFDIIPFIRSSRNDIFFIENFNANNDKIINSLCCIDDYLCALILKKNNVLQYSKWKSTQTKNFLVDTKNIKLFNYSGDDTMIFYKNRNIILNNNSSLIVTLEKENNYQNYIPLTNNSNIRFGQNLDKYNLIPEKSPFSDFYNKKQETPLYFILGYVHKNNLEMFPASYDDFDDEENWFFVLRFMGINYFPDGKSEIMQKNSDIIKIFFEKNIDISKNDENNINDKETLKYAIKKIMFQNDDDCYELLSLSKETLNIDLYYLNIIFYNRTNLKNIYGINDFLPLTEEIEFIIEKDELIHIILENETEIKINSVIDKNLNSIEDINKII